jgi:hypothetical protein
MMLSSDPSSIHLRRWPLAIILIVGAIAVHVLVIVISAIFLPASLDKFVTEHLDLISQFFFWGVLAASPAFILALLGFSILAKTTSAAYKFSPLVLSFMIALLSLPFSMAILLFVIGLGLFSCIFAVGVTFPLIIAIGFIIPLHLVSRIKGVPVICIVLATCIGTEFVWLKFLLEFLGALFQS